MAFRVLAPLIHLAGTETPHAYVGRILKFIPDELQRKHLLEQKMIEEIPDPLPPGVVADAAAPVPAPVPPATPAPPPQRPAATATKDSWVAYIVATGAATEAEAQALTKDQLIGMAG